MGKEGGEIKGGHVVGATGRRDFLRKAAIAGSFAVPMIVTVDPADAQALTSPPPEPPASSKPAKPPGSSLVTSPGTAGGAARESATGNTPLSGWSVSERSELPRTAADIDRLVAAGLAASAGGAALVLWSGHAQRTSTPEPPSPRPADPETAA